jgi:hypothetical protein
MLGWNARDKHQTLTLRYQHHHHEQPGAGAKKTPSAEPLEEPGWKAMSLSLSITANTASQNTALVLSRFRCVDINSIYT